MKTSYHGAKDDGRLMSSYYVNFSTDFYQLMSLAIYNSSVFIIMADY
jgi:hypothetical protein